MLCDCKRRDAALLAGVDSWKGLISQSINLRANIPLQLPADAAGNVFDAAAGHRICPQRNYERGLLVGMW